MFGQPLMAAAAAKPTVASSPDGLVNESRADFERILKA
jgi:hypothetical protein